MQVDEPSVRSNSPASEITSCIAELSQENAALETKIAKLETQIQSNDERFSCAIVSINQMGVKLNAANKHVKLAAGTSSNHDLRNQMIATWDGSMIPDVKAATQVVVDYLKGDRRTC